MSHFLQKIFDQPIRLTQEQKVNPILVLSEYFSDYDLRDVRHALWQIVEACLTSTGDVFDDPIERANLLCFYARLEALVEAAHLLTQPQKEGSTPDTTD